MTRFPRIPTPMVLLALTLASPLFLAFGNANNAPPGGWSTPTEASLPFATRSTNIGDELHSATVALASARRATSDKDYEYALRMAAEALVDAQVAEHRAQSTQARKAAQETQSAAQHLQLEIGRRRAFARD